MHEGRSIIGSARLTDGLGLEKLELADLNERLMRVEREIEDIGRELIPFYVRRKELRETIAATHKTIVGHDENDNDRLLIVGFLFEGKTERAAIFGEWTVLFHSTAPQREMQRRCRAQKREFKRQIKKLTDLIAKQEQKEAALKAKTIDLRANPDPVALLNPPFDPLTGEILA